MIADRDDYDRWSGTFWSGEDIEEIDEHGHRLRAPTEKEVAVESCRRLRHIRSAVWIVAIAVVVEATFTFINMIIALTAKPRLW
jgi:hypothetical protein